ncbi:hypothetical protein GOODEAATRI_012752 [Goodea atripinnis]|uniref:Secreted protein n=1 Tax=Goodea atripinnis TaxID=208336 RepID=A0ABV0PN46_9TELE
MPRVSVTTVTGWLEVSSLFIIHQSQKGGVSECLPLQWEAVRFSGCNAAPSTTLSTASSHQTHAPKPHENN